MSKYKEARRHIPEPVVWEIARQTADGLRYLQSQKVVHRDIKTYNIFVTANHTVKIGDLGVAVVLDDADKQHPREIVSGTPIYYAPELFRHLPYDFKVDAWAFGCVLYYLCNLRPPFRAKTLVGLGLKIVREAPPELHSEYSAELRETVLRLLEKDEARRPSLADLPQTFRRPDAEPARLLLPHQLEVQEYLRLDLRAPRRGPIDEDSKDADQTLRAPGSQQLEPRPLGLGPGAAKLESDLNEDFADQPEAEKLESAPEPPRELDFYQGKVRKHHSQAQHSSHQHASLDRADRPEDSLQSLAPLPASTHHRPRVLDYKIRTRSKSKLAQLDLQPEQADSQEQLPSRLQAAAPSRPPQLQLGPPAKQPPEPVLVSASSKQDKQQAFRLDASRPAGQSERAKTASTKQRLLKDSTQRQAGHTLKQYLLSKKEEQKQRLVSTLPGFGPAPEDKPKPELLQQKREHLGLLADSLDSAVAARFPQSASGKPSRIQTALPGKKPVPAERPRLEAPRQASAFPAKRPGSSVVYKRLTIHDLS